MCIINCELNFIKIKKGMMIAKNRMLSVFVEYISSLVSIAFLLLSPLLLVFCSALCSQALSLFLPLEQGNPTFSGKGAQPLLWAGAQAAHVKFAISGIPNCQNYCVSAGLEDEIGSIPT
jgi:hypothetical protein